MKLTQILCSLLIALLLSGTSLLGQVNAEFNTSITEGCSPLVVSFTDASTGSPTQWRWDFGNGNGSLQQNPSAIYLNPGVYTVRLVTFNGTSRDTMIKTQHITVFQDPTTNFVADTTSGCIPATVNFTDLSTPGDTNIISWLWGFGDGTTSTTQHPSHTYTNPGTYTVTLVTVDANGCREELSIDDYITIGNAPVADFNGGPRNACSIPHTVSFNNTSTGNGLSYFWDFGDGNTSTQAAPSHTYNSFGNFDVSLTVTNTLGCQDTRDRSNYIRVRNMSADFSLSDTLVCVNEALTFTDLSAPNPAAWEWDFGDGNTSTAQNPQHTYTTAGTYTVTLIATGNNNCVDTIVMVNAVTVEPAPVAAFTADTTSACSAPLNVQFNSTSAATGAVSYSWDFGDGGLGSGPSPNYTYSTTGTFAVSLTVTNAAGCSNTLTIPDFITVEEPTIAINANVRQGCIALPVSFTDSTISNDPIVDWLWDFGDGNTANTQNPSHIYANEGIFDVTLTITTAGGCIQTATFPNYIMAGDTPTVEFTANPLQTCLFYPIDFTDTSVIGNFWFWDFGDGGTSLDQNPTYQYSDTGYFDVTLIIGNNGCFDTLVKPNYIRIFPPEANFNVIYRCDSPTVVQFIDNSLGGHLWDWDFGTGDTSDLQDPVYEFPGTGNYTVTLTVTDTIGGCFDVFDMTVEITDPQAAFTGTNLAGCAPHTASFSSNSIDAVAHTWDFGDGNTGSGANTSHVYNTSGVYDVTLVVTDIHGCTDTFTEPAYVTVYDVLGGFTADTFTGCTPLTVTYTDTSSSVFGTVNSWQWDFGNGDTSTLPSPSTIYTTPGNYTVRLIVGDDNGCFDTVTKVNYILPTYPSARFNSPVTTVCLGDAVSFNNNSIGSGLSYVWDFGDGDSSTAFEPSHTYADTGVYTVSLYVVDVNGCDSTRIRNNYIRVTQPMANFAVDTLYASCPPLLVNFTDSSTAGIASWLYNFGDGQTSNLQDPSHIYNRPGVYHPSLIITDSIGCTDTIVYPDSIVIEGPYGSFTFLQTTICAPFDVEFYASGTDSAWLHIWDFGDGDVAVDDDTTSHTYADAGTYNPVMILDDQMGCVVSIPSPGPIVATVIEANFTATPLIFCQQGDVLFFDMSTGDPDVVAWEWHFGDGDTSHHQNPIHFYSGAGSYDVTLIATNSGGCSDTLVMPNFITIHPDPTAAFTVDQQVVCHPTTINYTDASTADTTITDWFWTFGDGNTSTLQNPSHVYAAPGTYTTTLVITNARGCSDTTSLDITVNPLPFAIPGNDTALCIGDTIGLSASGGVSYIWTPGNTMSDSTIATPLVFPTAETDYLLTVTDSNGCQDTAIITVAVNPLPTPVLSPDREICIGQSANINAQGGISYSWTPGSTLSDSTISNPMAAPTSTTTYQVLITDANGCQNTGSTDVVVNPLPITDIVPAQSICQGESANLWATGGVGYIWRPAGTLNAPNSANPIATPTGTTNYIVTVTDTNGCQSNDTTQVIVNPIPNPSITPDTEICLGESIQLNVNGGASYSWSPAAGLSCVNCPDPIANPNATTTYTATVTSAQGCTITVTTTITVRLQPVISITPDTLICPGEPVTIQASGGISYLWSPATGLSCTTCDSLTATPDSNITYVVEVTNIYGCVSYDSVSITVNQINAAFSVSDTTACMPAVIAFSDLSSSDSSIVAWEWIFDDGDTDTMQNPVHVYDTAGIYNPTLVVTSSTGCKDTASLYITIHGLPAADAGPDGIICINDTMQLNASGGLTYLWDDGITLSDSTVANPNAYPVSTTTYKLTVTDANGCQDTDDVTVTVNQLPTVTITGDSVSCSNVSIPLEATGGISYSWSPSLGLSDPNIYNPVANPWASTNYTVTVTDSNGCVNSESIYLQRLLAPVPVVSPDTSICRGDSILMQASGGDTYSWTPATGLSCTNCPEPMASPSQTTTYYVDISNITGCNETDSVTITVNPLPAIIISNDTTVCINEPVALSADGGIQYQWFSTQAMDCDTCAQINTDPDQSASYVVEVTSVNGCIGYDSIAVTVPNITANFAISDSFICTPATIEFRDLSVADSSIVSWGWDLGAGQSSQAQNPSYTYPTGGTNIISLIVTDNVGCSDTAQQSLTLLQTPEAEVSPDTVVCEGSDAKLFASGGVSYIWSNGNTLDDSTNASPLALPLVTTTYQVTVTAANGCIDVDSTTIFVNPTPQVTVTPGLTACQNDTVQLTATGGAVYSWSPTVGLTGNGFPNPTVIVDTSIMYTVTVADTNGCIARDSVEIKATPLPQLSLNVPPGICIGETAEISVSGADSYIWEPSGEFSCSSCTTTSLSPGQTDTYTVTGYNSNSCFVTDTFVIEVYELPTVETIDDVQICIGETVELETEATDVETFVWYPATYLDNRAIQSPAATTSETTTYTVTAISENNCVAYDSVTISVINKVTAEVTQDTTVCEGESVNLSVDLGQTGISGGQVTWIVDENTRLDQSNFSVTPRSTRSYMVEIYGGTCAVDTQYVKVSVNEPPKPELGENVYAVQGDSISLSSGLETIMQEYYWEPSYNFDCVDCETINFLADQSTAVVLTVTDSNGCIGADTVFVRVIESCEDDLFVPNSFSPNGDKVNDVLYVRGNKLSGIKIFRIFDRWGNLVFETEDVTKGWNGLYKGKMVDPGSVFVYYVEALCEQGGVVFKKGNVTVLR